MKLLTKVQLESYENKKICQNDKKYCKLRDHFDYTGECKGAVHSIWNLKYDVPKKIPIVFPNGSNDYCNFIMKELVDEF